MHPFLSDRLAAVHLDDLHAEAARRRLLRAIGFRPQWRFWRRSTPAADVPRVLIAVPRTRREGERQPADVVDGTLRPVA